MTYAPVIVNDADRRVIRRAGVAACEHTKLGEGLMAEGCDATAATHQFDGDRNDVRIVRRGDKHRSRPPGFGEGSAPPEPYRALQDVPLGDSFVTVRPCVLAQSGSCELIVPRMRWSHQRAINLRWRAVRGEVWGPISLLDPNIEQLHRVPGVVIRRRFEWRFGLVDVPSLLETP